MLTVSLRFTGELNDFLRKPLRHILLTKSLDHHTTVKDIIESYGVPHTEVDAIFVNGRSVDFNYHVDDGNIIGVYPLAESPVISGTLHLQERSLPEVKFVADVHLGNLARKMRILGLDVTFRNDFSDASLLEINRKEMRTLLTMNRHLLMHNSVRYGYLVRAPHPLEQLCEVCRRFNLLKELKPFTRCANCNGLLQSVAKSEVIERLEPKTRLYFDSFVRCEECSKIFWEGSHVDRLRELIEQVRNTCEQKETR
jgi:uncharacterized protein